MISLTRMVMKEERVHTLVTLCAISTLRHLLSVRIILPLILEAHIWFLIQNRMII
uniref:Uncharacterized protein n=1 Tax=virus sp. ctx9V1 TaxID=2828001 RepID=A0A8S5RDF0_9VIRU|nr:MAG TPA: hypothetical protein [virus sp. ctx9V1]